MSLNLNKKYRPSRFSEITGQEHVKLTVQNQIEKGKLPHAFIFCGPRGVGKTTTARILAKSLNCEKRKEGESEPCNECDSCKAVISNNSLDVIEIDAASHTGVDNVRENIIANARTATKENRYKVFILDEVHMLSLSSFNALLKTLEEPPARVIFVLATTEIHKVPVTILSRCQRFDYQKVSIDDLVQRLSHIAKEEGVKIDEDVLTHIASLSGGFLRDAVSLLGQVLSLDEKNISMKEAGLVLPKTDIDSMLKLFSSLVENDAKAGIELINEMTYSGVNLIQFVEEFTEVLRRMMLFKVDESLADLKMVFDEKKEKEVVGILANVSLAKIQQMIEVMMKRSVQLKAANIPQLPLEIAVLELTQETAPIPQVVQTQAAPRPVAPAASTVSEKKQQPLAQAKPIVKETPAPQAEPESEALIGMEFASSIQTQISDIKAQWIPMIDGMVKTHHSLAIILRNAAPVVIDGAKLVLGVEFPLYKDKINDPEKRKIVSGELQKIFGELIDVEARLNKDIGHVAQEEPQPVVTPKADTAPPKTEEKPETGAPAPATEGSATLDDVLEVFGGEIT